VVAHHPANRLAGLAPHLRGRLVVPGDPDWDTARKPWNRRIDQRPAAVVMVEGAGDIAAVAALAAPVFGERTRHSLATVKHRHRGGLHPVQRPEPYNHLARLGTGRPGLAQRPLRRKPGTERLRPDPTRQLPGPSAPRRLLVPGIRWIPAS